MARLPVSRQIHNWNTYSAIGFNRLIKLPEKYELRPAVFLPEKGLYASRFYFTEETDNEVGQLLRVIHHAPYGEFIQMHLAFQGYTFEITAASSDEGELACMCRPLAGVSSSALYVLEVEKLWKDGSLTMENGVISFPLENGEIICISAGSKDCGCEGLGLYMKRDQLIRDLGCGGLNGAEGKGRLAALLFDGRQPLFITAARGAAADNTTVEERLQEAHAAYCLKMPSSSGLFDGSVEALNTAANAQVSWDNIHGLLYTPVTRRWNDFYQVKLGLDPQAEGPVIGLWDSLFASLMHSGFNREAAVNNLLILFDETVVTESGFPPNYVAHPIKSGDRSQPPLASLVAWKIFLRDGDRDLLAHLYPGLKRWNRWWPQARDGNSDGLLEWGSNISALMPGNDAGTLFGAKCESGMDNSPLFDEAQFIEDKAVMDLSSIGLSSLYAADCLYLAKIAGELGMWEEQLSLQQDYDAMKERINRLLWSAEDRNYLDRYWDGRFSRRFSPTSFFPLLARIPTRERAEQVVSEYLLDEKKFWGEYVFPSISRDDPAFDEQVYWRGRIWPPLNYLVYLGLKEYGFDDIAGRVALKSFRLFMKEWLEYGHCHENYHALKGSGCDVLAKQEECSDGCMGNIGSDPFYTWGALLLQPAVDEVINTDPDGGLCFGNAWLEKSATLDRISFGDSLYRINTSADSLEVFKDDKLLLASFPGVNVRRFREKNDLVSCSIKGRGPVTLELHVFSPGSSVRVIGDNTLIGIFKCCAAGKLAVPLHLDQNYREFRFEINQRSDKNDRP